MNKNIRLLLILLIGANISFAQVKVRIACVGNSITYGAGMEDRKNNSYPAQLQNMLGSGYEVMNFGRSGATLLKNTNNSYWDSKEYQAALASQPNLVFIKLGTNDSKAPHRANYHRFVAEYKELISSFQQLSTHPRVVLLLPVPSFMTDSLQIWNPVIVSRIIPMVQQVAFEARTELINLYPYFVEHPELFPDNIHPSSLGATIIAKRVYEAVKAGTDKSFNIFSAIQETQKITSFYGFDCADFKYNGRACKVVKPRIVAAGRPWVWRARFWGHEPQTDISLLERGYHIVYCDVAELFGNKEAISIWNSFYALMQRCGLSKKAAMEGMSRGGIYIYNWALANPGKVACIYADAPVLDLKSWPGGKRNSGAKDVWETFKKDYQLSEEAALRFNNNPLDHAEKIARLGFPMLHVVGDADDVVPVKENTIPFEERVKLAGGDITVIHKPGVNHHPHSLKDPTPITNFILAATGHKTNFAAIPAPGAEYRSGAGWTPGKGWWQQKENIDSLLGAAKGLDIVFLGNSITQGTGGHRNYVTHKPGLAAFNEAFGQYQWECAGISGDRTQNVLFRLQQGNFAKAAPKVLVVTIGVNNFIENDSPAEIAAGIRSIAEWAVKNMPATKLIISGPLPTGIKKEDPRRKKFEQIHQLLSKTKGRYLYFPVIHPFHLPNGDLDLTKYSGDGIHLQSAGYRAWAMALKPVIDKNLKR